jgi:predicted lipoprotein with Yx(FWY)xxD motif
MAFWIIATCFVPLNLSAQWSTDPTVNNVVCSTVNQQLLDSRIASDGSGGALIAWSDRNVVTNGYFIYVQRISSDGKKLWAEDGVAVSTSANEQRHSEVTGDGKGGAIVTWFETRNGKNEARVQKISSDGVVQWNAEGVPVGTVETHFQHSTPVIASRWQRGSYYCLG